MSIIKRCEKELKKLADENLLRQTDVLTQVSGKFLYNKKEIINFSSNDYLNFSQNKEIKNAAIEGIRNQGCSSASSRLLSGSLDIHEKIESIIAERLGYENAILFGCGFMTNMGVISTLASKSDVIISDKLAHASIIDAIKMSEARHHRFNHNDIGHLEKIISKYSKETTKFIITESVFSMDGDIAPLDEISRIAKKYNAFLIIDEAHAIGAFGSKGEGIAKSACKNIKPDLIVGTLSKAIGNYGGFTACSTTVIKYLINKSRNFIFSTSLPPSTITGSIKAFELLAKNNYHEKLDSLSSYFRKILQESGFDTGNSSSQIVPVIIGDNNNALQISQALRTKNIFVKAIRPPAVPEGSARLRFSVTLAHTRKDLENVTEILLKSTKRRK